MKTRILIVFVVFLLHCSYGFSQERMWIYNDSYQSQQTFSPDSRFIAISSKHPPRVEIFDVETGDILHTLPECKSPKFTPDGRFLYSVPTETENPEVFLIWDTEDWLLHSQLEIPFAISRHHVYEFSTDGKYLAYFAHGGEAGLIVYNVSEKKIKTTCTDFPILISNKWGPEYYIGHINFSYDNRYIAFSNRWSYIYDLQADSLIHTMYLGVNPKFSHTNNTFYTHNRFYRQGGDGDYIDHGGLIHWKDIYNFNDKEIILEDAKGEFGWDLSVDDKYLVYAYNNIDIIDIVAMQQSRIREFNTVLHRPLILIARNSNRFLLHQANTLSVYNIERLTSITEESPESVVQMDYINDNVSGNLQITVKTDKMYELKLELVDMTGRKTQISNPELFPAGIHHFEYSTNLLSSGVYILNLYYSGKVLSRTLHVVR